MPESSGKGPLVAMLGCLGVLLIATITLAAFTAGIVVGKARPAPVSAPASGAFASVATATSSPSTSAGRAAPAASPATPSGFGKPGPACTPSRPVPDAGTPAGDPPASRLLDLPTNDLVYDPANRLIWASVPGSGGDHGNAVVPIDPATGKIGTPIPVGSEPDTLALSDDGCYLYVGLDGARAVRRVNLPEQKADLLIPLGADPRLGPYFPGDISVMPGHSNVIAVARHLGRDFTNAPAGVALYVDGDKLPDEPSYPASTSITSITFCGSATTLYGFAGHSTGSSLYTLVAGDEGLGVADMATDLLSAYGQRSVLCVEGRIYTTKGEVLDPTTKTLLGTCGGLDPASPVRPDPATGHIFFLNATSNQKPQILVYDAQTFVRDGSFPVSGLTYPITTRDLVRWGADGLAFGTAEGKVYLLRSPLVGGGP